jgi:transcriptional regulator with XRE-family HTH domain
MFKFGERLLKVRKDKGWSQDEIAKIGGVAKRTYCNYESGEREPGAAFLEAIAAAGADVQYILTGVPGISARVEAPLEPPADPLVRRKEKIKAMIDQFDDERGLEEIQDDLQKIKQRRADELELAELRKQVGRGHGSVRKSGHERK